jgi:glutaredoxin-related protein
MRTATKMTKSDRLKKFLRRTEKNAAETISGEVDDAWEQFDETIGSAVDDLEDSAFKDELERFENEFDREPTPSERTLIGRFIQVGFGAEIGKTFDIYSARGYIGVPAFRILRRRHH